MQPDPRRNGKSELNGKNPYPILEPHRPLQSRSPYRGHSSSLLPLVVLSLVAGIIAALIMHTNKQPALQVAVPQTEAFRWGVNRAMNAAELTQIARSPQEWQQIVSWWQEAIELMGAVPRTEKTYSIAASKITEYQNNLKYAESRLERAPVQLPTQNLWGIGSRRAAVISIQGEPTSIDRYDAVCKEILHYGKSQVELNNGVVVGFEDFDRRLKTLALDTPLPTIPSQTTWDLGSTKADVFRIQGTPSRVVDYDYSDRETLYYDGSTIELARQRVIGYRNEGNNLRVRLSGIAPRSTQPFWTLESSREEVLQIQGTPKEVLLESAACSETFYYGNSTVLIKNGFITGYDNFDNNLRVRAK
ncbi:MAG: hypothetical protein MUF72_21535 [Elainella sp. Prado103]|jgi:hypothetical protein|nr:hypothetical protein [Elainella sp. Prado103]